MKTRREKAPEGAAEPGARTPDPAPTTPPEAPEAPAVESVEPDPAPGAEVLAAVVDRRPIFTPIQVPRELANLAPSPEVVAVVFALCARADADNVARISASDVIEWTGLSVAQYAQATGWLERHGLTRPDPRSLYQPGAWPVRLLWRYGPPAPVLPAAEEGGPR